MHACMDPLKAHTRSQCTLTGMGLVSQNMALQSLYSSLWRAVALARSPALRVEYITRHQPLHRGSQRRHITKDTSRSTHTPRMHTQMHTQCGATHAMTHKKAHDKTRHKTQDKTTHAPNSWGCTHLDSVAQSCHLRRAEVGGNGHDAFPSDRHERQHQRVVAYEQNARTSIMCASIKNAAGSDSASKHPSLAAYASSGPTGSSPTPSAWAILLRCAISACRRPVLASARKNAWRCARARSSRGGAERRGRSRWA